MKKTIPITLSGILFHIEEDAYEKLSAYLDSIRSYFRKHDGEENSAEIVKDIESRISEQFLENGNKDRIVTLQNVETLITSMGTVEDFSNGEKSESSAKEESGTHSESSGNKTQKKLFRNPDDVVIAGVASGLAAYLGLDPVIIRIIFIAIVLLGGSGILIYIILWLVMPLAKTSTDKLQMRGEKVTLESVKETMKEKVDEVHINKGVFRKIIHSVIEAARTVVNALVPVGRKIIGGLVSFAAGVGIFALVFFMAIVFFNMESPYVNFPLLQLGHTPLIYLGLLAALFGVLVPLIFLLSTGRKIWGKKNTLKTSAVVTLVIIWCVSATTVGVISARLAPEWQHFMETSPLYRETTRDFFDMTGFENVQALNGSDVSIVIGPEFKITATGIAQDLEEVSLSVANNTLSVGHKDHFRICIFCSSMRPHVVVTLPKLSEIDAHNGSWVNSDAIDTDTLNLKLSNGSNAELKLNVQNLTVEEENASWASLSGTSTTVHVTLSNGSSLKANELRTQDLTLAAQNASTAEISAEKTLKATLRNGSYVIYSGDPTVTKDVKNGSVLKKEGESEEDGQD